MLRAPLGCPASELPRRAHVDELGAALGARERLASRRWSVRRRRRRAADRLLNGHIVGPPADRRRLLRLLDEAVVEHLERAAGEDRLQRPVDALHGLDRRRTRREPRATPTGSRRRSARRRASASRPSSRRALASGDMPNERRTRWLLCPGASATSAASSWSALGAVLRAFEDAEHCLTDDHGGHSFSETAETVVPGEPEGTSPVSGRPGGTRRAAWRGSSAAGPSPVHTILPARSTMNAMARAVPSLRQAPYARDARRRRRAAGTRGRRPARRAPHVVAAGVADAHELAAQTPEGVGGRAELLAAAPRPAPASGTNASTGNQSPRYCLSLISLPSTALRVKVGASRPTPKS